MLGILIFLLMVILLLVVIFSFSQPTKPWENKSATEEINEEKETNKKDWFTPQRWLTDREIDWANETLLEQKLPGVWPEKRYKVLESTQFYFVKEFRHDPAALISFPVLLNELTSFKGDLVFIPVNQPDFHWSLLVYDVNDTCFYHWDTLAGANDSYVRPLVKELLQQLLQTNEVNLGAYLIPCYQIKQGNGYDCGVAVISIIKRIREKYSGDLEYIQLGEFDFGREREELRERYLGGNN